MTSGEQMVLLANQHKGERYVLGSLAPKNNADYRGPWDCAELMSWTIYQVSHKLYGCLNNNADPASADSYTGYLGRDADSLGQKISVTDGANIPGAILLRLAAENLTGHAVFSEGTGNSTVEANSTKYGLINSHIIGRRWDYAILIPWLSYLPAAHANPIPAPSTLIYRYMNPMMRGDVVKTIQTALATLGYLQTADVDGIFGRRTYGAVRSFQSKYGITADGEVGPQTAKALNINL